MRISPLTGSNVLVTGLVLVLVVALFFIPEIIDFQRALVTPGQERSVNDEYASLAPARQFEPTDRPVSPLEHVVSMMEAEDSTPTSGDEETEIPSGGTEKFIKDLGDQRLSWQALQGDASAQALRAAREESLALAKSIHRRNVGSRYALFNFANALAVTLEPKTARVMTPEEMVSYLEALDHAVTRTMSREMVDRADYLKWAGISLGPVLESTRIGRLKQQFTMPFNPQFTLTSLSVRHPPNSMGKYKPQGRVYIRGSGYVMGRDVEKIVILHENGAVAKVLKPSKDKDGYRFFRIGQLDAREVWTFKVYDKYGDTYTKRYAFYPRVQAFPWSARERGYTLPFRNVNATPDEFSAAMVDARLDRFFRYENSGGGWNSSPDNVAYATF